ncbi:hypothetical protein QBC44DRAFT_402441 [Cladorrhinum sp. PSN332]|nr:hypothetical protein QBC44DRAFT_402441 [Cladorrhinum sp. PSN332]
MGSLPTPKRILLLTNSEHGQANVFLATSFALLTLSPSSQPVEIHFASFPPIQKFVHSISHHAQQANPNSLPIIFHPVSGVAMVSAWSRPETTAERQSLRNLDLFDAIQRMRVLLKVTLPWKGPEFVQIMHSVLSILGQAKPDAIAVDPAFSPALTALRHARAKFVVLSPNAIKDFAMPHQPNGEALWRYPVTGTPHAFPLPVWRIPGNVLLVLIALLCSAVFDSNRREIQRLVDRDFPGAELTTLNDLSLRPEQLKTKFLVANLRELEFPLSNVPGHIIPCGPMIRPALKVDEVDPRLAKWLARARTVYINLGTHLFFDEEFAVEMAKGVKILLDYARSVEWVDLSKRLRGLQVLWKLNNTGDAEEVKGPWAAVRKVLGEEIDRDLVRVVEWIEAEPTAVLEAGTVVCAVHHGGANTFLETVSAGVPQVVLPVWMDTYDFARRAEHLGIGRWGNRLSGTDKVCKGEELGSVLIDVVVGGRWSVYADNSKRLADLCKKNGGGRAIAARHILAEMDVQDEDDEDESDGFAHTSKGNSI